MSFERCLQNVSRAAEPWSLRSTSKHGGLTTPMGCEQSPMAQLLMPIQKGPCTDNNANYSVRSTRHQSGEAGNFLSCANPFGSSLGGEHLNLQKNSAILYD